MVKKHARDAMEEELDATIDVNLVPFWTSARLALAVLGFFGFILVYAVRVNLSVAIVCMVNKTAISIAANDNHFHDNSSVLALNSNETVGTVESECGGVVPAVINASAPVGQESSGKLVWDKTTQGLVLGSFFWGYLVSQIPGGLVAVRIGGKWCYGGAMIVAAVLTLITPIVATHSFEGMMAVRVILGAASGISFPAMHCLWGAWAPPMERTKLMAFTYAGAQVGNVITFPLAGFLCKYGFAGGWPSIFYVLGALCLVWVALWAWLASNTPEEHKRITDIERRYITSSLRTVAQSNESKKNVPWCKIATSMPNYAIIVSNVTSDWGAYTLLTNIPTYISEVLKFDIASNGLVSALPYIGMWATMNISGWLSDLIRKKRFLSTGATRKVMDAFGKVAAGALLVALGYIDCSQPAAAIALLVMAVSIAGFQYSGFLVNHVDIAPQYAGILFGISNSIAAVTGFTSPVVVGIITAERQTRSEWQIVFYVAAAIYLFGAIFYVIFASGVLQPWAMKGGSETDVDDNAGEPVLLAINGKEKEQTNGHGDRLILNDMA